MKKQCAMMTGFFRKFGRKLFLIYYSWVCGQIFERALNPHFFFDNTLKEVALKCFKSFPTVGLFEMKEKLIDYFFLLLKICYTVEAENPSGSVCVGISLLFCSSKFVMFGLSGVEISLVNVNAFG